METSPSMHQIPLTLPTSLMRFASAGMPADATTLASGGATTHHQEREPAS